MDDGDSSGRQEPLQEALASVARTIADSLDITEVWPRVTEACRVVVPFDGMGIARFEGPDCVRLVVGSDKDLKPADHTQPRAAFSPQSWPNSDDFMVVIGDASKELDLAFPVDRLLVSMGYRSVIRLPLGRGETRFGSLLIAAFETHRFTKDHARALKLVAEMVALALAHQRLAEEARQAAAAEQRAARLEHRVQTLAAELESVSPHQAVGRSRAWKEVLGLSTKVAPTETTVLVTGESGTGKEVVARFLHRGSPRKDGPFVALNCAALPEQLLESELFGHERGAFTGALVARAGKLEQAAGGVLFLDEVGEMSPTVQAKFLRVLEAREFQRVGGARTLNFDARVLAATNRDLKTAIATGHFREDLYYRIAVFEIRLPPLRERPEDILLLVNRFLEQLARTVGRSAAGLSDEARACLLAHSWPGNVRELRNAIERAAILCDGGLITSEHLPIPVLKRESPDSARVLSAPAASSAPSRHSSAPPPGGLTLDTAERELIEQALMRAGNNKSKAARLLGLTRAQLRSRLEKHGISGEG
jgi:transcriptional regulator with GAF, ATPase, and Fis domain